MTKDNVIKFKGYNEIIKTTKKATPINSASWVNLYINFSEKKIKAIKESESDYFLTRLINPCTKNDLAEIIVKMLSY